MAWFGIQDLQALENAPTSPSTLRQKFWGLIENSTTSRAKVDVVNPETGQYRIILQGTLNKEATKFEQG